jgi:murein L,D-transpeptidase YcbB/YkuD
MKTTSILLVLLSLPLTTACNERAAAVGSTSAPPAAAASAASPASHTQGPAAGAAIPEVRQRAIVVDTHVTVKNVDASVRSLREKTEQVGGYIADANVSGEHDGRTARLDLRVPAGALRPFLSAIAESGQTASYQERAEDVTEQITDLRARLNNARLQEKRIGELMATKTANLAETMQAEHELARIRELIERLDAEDRAVTGRVAYATVHVGLSEVQVVTAFWQTPGKSLGEAASTGLHGAASLFMGLLMLAMVCLPSLLPIALFVALAWYIGRKLLARRTVALRATALRAED